MARARKLMDQDYLVQKEIDKAKVGIEDERDKIFDLKTQIEDVEDNMKDVQHQIDTNIKEMIKTKIEVKKPRIKIAGFRIRDNDPVYQAK